MSKIGDGSPENVKGVEICVNPEFKVVPRDEINAGYAINCPGHIPDYQICNDTERCSSLNFRCCMVR